MKEQKDDLVGITPTPERARRGVEQVDINIDDRGRPMGPQFQPYRGLDTLSKMERRGSITSEMRTAGEEFRALFRLAHLDSLRAADMSREPVSGHMVDSPGARIERARVKVWKTIRLLGGLASPPGRCAWDVLGCEMSLKEWGKSEGWRGKPVDKNVAAGILIAALAVLSKQNA